MQNLIKNWSKKEIDLYLNTLDKKKWRIEHLYKIRDKKRRTVNLILNPLQVLYWNEATNRDILLKARKIGFSTFGLIDALDDTVWYDNFTAFIMAHRREDVQKLFQIIHFAYDQMPAEIKPKAEYYNKNELYFKDRNSRVYVGMEARSDVINRLHVSEAAFIEDAQKKLAASFEAVPKEGKIILETTPNGVGGYFYELYQLAAGYTDTSNGKSEFKTHFFPWFKHPEYRVKLTKTEKSQINAGNYLTTEEREFAIANALDYEQMKWRKEKKARLAELFDEQYPEDDISCFLGSGQNYFDLKALKTQLELVNA